MEWKMCDGKRPVANKTDMYWHWLSPGLSGRLAFSSEFCAGVLQSGWCMSTSSLSRYWVSPSQNSAALPKDANILQGKICNITQLTIQHAAITYICRFLVRNEYKLLPEVSFISRIIRQMVSCIFIEWAVLKHVWKCIVFSGWAVISSD